MVQICERGHDRRVLGLLCRENVIFLILLASSYTTHLATIFSQNTKSNRVIKTIPVHQIEHVDTQITCKKNTAHASIKILLRMLLRDGQKRPQKNPKSRENALGLIVVRLLTFFWSILSFSVVRDSERRYIGSVLSVPNFPEKYI